MNWYWLLIGLILVGLSVLVLSNHRLIKSFFLITQISPYEQSGSTVGHIHIIGDSTGYGTGASSNEYSIAGLIGNDWPEYKITNDSVNGRKLKDVIKNPPTLEGKYSLILIQLGANDLLQGRNLPAIRADVNKLIEILEPHTENIVLMSACNIGTSPAFSGARAESLEAASREYTRIMLQLEKEQQNLHFVPLFAERADDPFANEPDVYHAIDGLHPSDKGYQSWYQKLKPTLLPLLQ